MKGRMVVKMDDGISRTPRVKGSHSSGLPGWARPELLEAFEERKLARCRAMTPEQRAGDLEMLCETALQLVGCRPDSREVLRLETPVPESTRRLLKRLRQGYRWRGVQS
ncbi:MAG: hypothetical protein HY814_06095 [Candidatus Riflebacteria bacterium]|nr:hypothetical protein [Candidatus Riflebacteria bacterium]